MENVRSGRPDKALDSFPKLLQEVFPIPAKVHLVHIATRLVNPNQFAQPSAEHLNISSDCLNAVLLESIRCARTVNLVHILSI